MIHFNRSNLFDPSGNADHVETTSTTPPTLAEMPEDLLLELSPLLNANDVLALSLASRRLHRVFDVQLKANQVAMHINGHAGSSEEYGQLHQTCLDFVASCTDACARRTVLTALAQRVGRNPPECIHQAWRQILVATTQLPFSLQVQPLDALLPWVQVPEASRWGMFKEILPVVKAHTGKDFVTLFMSFTICLDAMPDEFAGQAFGLLLEQVHKLKNDTPPVGLGMLMSRIDRVREEQVLQAFEAISIAWVQWADARLHVPFLGMLIACLPRLPASHFKTHFEGVAQAIESTPEKLREQLLWAMVEQLPHVSAEWWEDVQEWILTAAAELPSEAQGRLFQKMLLEADEAP